MLDYATLDAIADSYNPLLLLLSLLYIGAAYFKGHWKMGGRRAVGFAVVVLVAYGLMFADKRYGLWEGLGLDYSTHTATSIGMVLFLSYFTSKLSVSVGLGASFILYAGLMLYQRYHSFLDILTTGVIVVLLLCGAVMVWRGLQMPARNQIR